MHKPETCTAKTYSHVRGAPLRGDILRQLAEGAEHIAPDMRIPKRALDRLFYFEPLVTLSCDEEAALKAAVWNMMADKYSCGHRYRQLGGHREVWARRGTGLHPG